MNKKSFFICLTILFLYISSDIFSQNLYNISGFVKDKTSGEPLVGANVLIYKNKIETNQPPYSGASTNNYGFYVIPKISPGKYLLIVRSVGFKTVIKEIEMTSRPGDMLLNIEISSEDITLEEVVITGEKEAAGNVSSIDVSPELLAKLPSLTGEVDLFKMLQSLPGVNMANELSSGLYVRGGSPDQNLTLVDGVMLYNPAHIGNIASSFNTNAIRDIKLLKGAFPAQYGGRLSSILDIKLRSGTKEKETGIAGFGLINSFLTIEGPISEKATYMFSGRGMYYDAVQKAFNKESTMPYYNFYDLNSKLNFTYSDSNVISISSFYSKDRLYNPPSVKDLDYDIQWANTIFAFNWMHISSGSLFLNSSLSFVNYKFKTIIGGDPDSSSLVNYFSSSNLSDINFKQDIELRWQQDHTLKGGVEFCIHNYDLQYSNSYNRLIETDPFADHTLTANEGAFYLQNESKFGALLKTNIGGRLYYFGEKKYIRFEPRVSATYALTEDMFLKGGFAVAHQFLHLITRNDITLPTGLWFPSTSKTEPAKSTQYVLGLDTYLNNREYLLSVEAYYKDMRNLIEFKGSASLDPFDNSVEDQFTSGMGEAYGAELFFNKQAGNFTGWIGYTLSWTKRKFSDLNSGNPFYPKYDRRNDISIVMTYNVTPSFTMGLNWVFATGQRYTLAPGQFQFANIGLDGTFINLNYSGYNESLFPDYHKLDLNFTYKFNWMSRAFSVYLNLFNVYNRQNVFAQYIVVENDAVDLVPKTKLKRISLFPFLPVIGFNFKF